MEPLLFILLALFVLGSGLVALVYFGFVRKRKPKTGLGMPANPEKAATARPGDVATPVVAAEALSDVTGRRPFDLLRTGPQPIEAAARAEADEPREEAQPAAASTSTMPATPTSLPDTPQGPRPRILIATLLREEVTGKLIVKVGNREYLSPEELADSADKRKVEYASADLQRWFGAPPPEAHKGTEPEEAPANPRTMVEQINQIMARKILSLPQEKRAIRLVEGADGNVRVYIGLKAYALSEIPDEEVRRLIREAVSEWEARS